MCCKCHLHLNAERERDGCGNGELFGMKPFACMATAWKEIPSGGSKASNFTGQGQLEDYVMGKRAAAHERNASATARAVCSLCDSILSLVGQGSPRQRSRSDFRRRRLIHRCLLARSGEQFSWVKIVELHSGKGSETKKRINHKNKNKEYTSCHEDEKRPGSLSITVPPSGQLQYNTNQKKQ